MMFHVANNRAGAPCVVDEDGTHDLMATAQAANAECDRLNALEAKTQRRRERLAAAGFKLAELAGVK